MAEHPFSHATGEPFVQAGAEAIALIDRYWQRLGGSDPSLPVKPQVRPGDVLQALPAFAPEQGEPLNAALSDIERVIIPALTHWQHPQFYAYFPCNGSPPAVLGELISAGLGVNGMLWATSPAATELEERMLDWMQSALGLPEHFRNDRAAIGDGSGGGGGCIQGTASEATLVAMLTARNCARRAGVRTPLTAYCSQQAHSSVLKAGMIAGLADSPDGEAFDGSGVRLVPVREDLRMDVRALAAMIAADRAAGKTPIFVCSTLGTTGTMAFDDLREVGEAIDAPASHAGPSIWLHVDAAMAGAAWICPEFRGPLAGMARADSLCFNPHKWLLTSFDCDLFWTRDRRALTLALGITPEYLKTGAAGVTDYRDWQVPLGRRFRALKLWMVLRHYGLDALRGYIREHVRIAALAESELKADGRFELPVPRHSSSPLVVFRPSGDDATPEKAAALNARCASLMERLNASGRVLLSHTTIPDPRDGFPSRYVLRLAVGGSFTRESHVREAVGLIRQMF